MSVPGNALPKTPADVETYVARPGLDMAIVFLLTFGGAELSLSRRPTQRSRVATLVGKDKAAALAWSDHLLQLRVPLATPWLAACLHVRDWPLAEIARRMRITDVTVRRHLNSTGCKGNRHALRADLDAAREKLTQAIDLLRAARAAPVGAASALENAVELAVNGGFNTLSTAPGPVCLHRRDHRPGRPDRIKTDPDLRCFTLARIDRMDLVDQIADHVPPDRRFVKSALHHRFRKHHHKSHPRSSNLFEALPVSKPDDSHCQTPVKSNRRDRFAGHRDSATVALTPDFPGYFEPERSLGR